MIATIISLGLAFQNLQDDMVQRMLKFDAHYIAFKADLLGCPKGATLVSQCKPEAGTINYREFVICAREARKLFQLEDPK